MTAVEYTNALGQTVSEVPGQPGKVTTGRPNLTMLHNPTTIDPFALIPGCGDIDEECLTCPPGMPCYCTADSSDDNWDRERD